MIHCLLSSDSSKCVCCQGMKTTVVIGHHTTSLRYSSGFSHSMYVSFCAFCIEMHRSTVLV